MEKQLFITKFDKENILIGVPKTVLMIGAHPDDIEINAGGLTAALIKNKSQVNWLICTDGGSGSWNHKIDRQSLIKIRKKEQIDAANILEVNRVSFLDFSDGYLFDRQNDLFNNLVNKIRELKPEMIVTHDPWKQYMSHADHRIVGEMVSHAMIMASNSTLLKDNLEQKQDSHFTKYIGYFCPEVTNAWIDLSSFSKKKEQAILAHCSQYGDRLSFIDKIRQETEIIGREINVKQAEAFHIGFNN